MGRRERLLIRLVVKKSRNKYGLLGLGLTALWVLVILTYLVSSNSNPFGMKPNEFGDFWAGVVGPLALLWIVLGFWQQGQELKNSVDALNLQSQELRNSVRQQEALVETTRQQLEQDISLSEQKRHRTLQGRRACMLMPLNEISTYTEACLLHALELFHSFCDGNLEAPYEPTNIFPEYPQEAFNAVQLVIESADNEVAYYYQSSSPWFKCSALGCQIYFLS